MIITVTIVIYNLSIDVVSPEKYKAVRLNVFLTIYYNTKKNTTRTLLISLYVRSKKIVDCYIIHSLYTMYIGPLL